jgi:hypothetical protein
MFSNFHRIELRSKDVKVIWKVLRTSAKFHERANKESMSGRDPEAC